MDTIQITRNVLYNKDNASVLLVGSNGKLKKIGEIHDLTFYTLRKEKGIFSTDYSIGFDYNLIKEGKFEFVSVRLPNGLVLSTTREYILQNGAVRQFKSNGNQLQIFLQIAKFNKN